jgi:hypothetical protein
MSFQSQINQCVAALPPQPAAVGPGLRAVDDDAAAASDLWQRAATVLRPDGYRILWLRYAQGLTLDTELENLLHDGKRGLDEVLAAGGLR